jgi:signal peptidase II
VLVYNPGAAFSFLGNQGGWQRYFFTAIAVVAIGFIIYLLKRMRASACSAGRWR